MYDILEIIDNINTIYSSNDSLAILKDFERVIDELDVYAFKNWEDGEIILGPNVERHWVTCAFMWPIAQMPDPEAARRLSEFGCLIGYKKSVYIKPRKIKNPSDFRPGTKKGKLDEHPIWVVEIQMPKKLILDVFRGYHADVIEEINPAGGDKSAQLVQQPAEQIAASETMNQPNMQPETGVPSV